VRDKIVALPTMYIWRMMNFGKADILGVDVSASLHSRFAKDFSLQANAAYSWQRAVDVTDSSAKNYHHQLPYTPVHSGSFSLVFENPMVDVTYMLAAVGERYMLPQNTERNLMNGYLEHSFVLNREFRLKNARLHLQGKLMNVGGRQYEVIRYYPMPGFSWQVSAGVKF
jgi:outer membrane receptor protein involved in Fe transport